MKFPERWVRAVTNSEAKAAFKEQCPIRCGGITYKHISALIYRMNQDHSGTVLQVELLDRAGHSVTIAAPDRIERGK